MGVACQVTLSRRRFLAASAAAAGAAGTSCNPDLPAPGSVAVDPFELDEITIAGLQEGMRTGRYTARQVAEKYLARIERTDRSGPGLRSVIETNPDAVAAADVLDEERRKKGPRGPLHGIPVLIKDNIESLGRMATSAGSLALERHVPGRDAFVTARLRAAGAVILGKTNLSEWANFRSTHSSSGWSARGGQTRNPYALDRNPCGSSSGSGVAAAANLCAAAVGTETDGSIVCPSAINGIVGIKPTVGLVSRTGIIPIAHSQDTAGPMARTVTDAAILLTAMAGPDARDPVTATAGGNVHSDYTVFLRPDGLHGARIGVARKFFGYNRHVDRVLESALAAMKKEGAVLVDPADVPGHDQYDEAEFEVLLYEFKADLNAYLAGLGRGAAARSLQALIAYNERNAAREMPFFGQEIFIMAEARGPLTDKPYLDALARCRRLSRTEGIDALMREQELDAVVAPAGGPAWLTDLVNGDHSIGGSSSPAAVAGYPNITVPAGFVHGLPVGISFFGTAWSEPRLLRLAFAFEQATRRRRPPRYLATADLNA